MSSNIKKHKKICDLLLSFILPFFSIKSLQLQYHLKDNRLF